MKTQLDTPRPYYPKWLIIIGALLFTVNLYGLIASFFLDCSNGARKRGDGYEYFNHILALFSLGGIAITPLSAIRKAPNWNINFYERALYYVHAF